MEEVAAVVNCTPTPQPVHPDIRAIDMSEPLHVVYIVHPYAQCSDVLTSSRVCV